MIAEGLRDFLVLGDRRLFVPPFDASIDPVFTEARAAVILYSNPIRIEEIIPVKDFVISRVLINNREVSLADRPLARVGDWFSVIVRYIGPLVEGARYMTIARGQGVPNV